MKSSTYKEVVKLASAANALDIADFGALPKRATNSYGPQHGVMLYAIRTGEFVKFGITRNVAQRLRAISQSMPYECRLAGVLPGSRLLERQVHNRFKSAHVTLEWFRLTAEIEAFISEMQEPEHDT